MTNEPLLAEEQAEPSAVARLEEELVTLKTNVDELNARLEAAEAWICRRPEDAIPQRFVDQITTDAIASVTPVEEEVPDGSDKDVDLTLGE